MTQSLNIFYEVAEFMAAMNPEKVVAFKPSKALQDRLDLLLEKQKSREGLSPEEESEVENYLIINRIIGLAKARALSLLAAA